MYSLQKGCAGRKQDASREDDVCGCLTVLKPLSLKVKSQAMCISYRPHEADRAGPAELRLRPEQLERGAARTKTCHCFLM